MSSMVFFPDAPARRVDYTKHAHVVVRVRHDPEIGDHILDFLPLEKGLAARDLVGDILREEGLLKGCRVRLLVRTRTPTSWYLSRSRNWRVLIIEAMNSSLPAFILGVEDFDGFSAGGPGPEFLGFSILVVRDESVRRREDRVRGAVVLFEFYFFLISGKSCSKRTRFS